MTTHRTLALAIAVALALTSSMDGQTRRTNRVMREKLEHAQRMLEALTTSDYAMLRDSAGALVRVVDSPEWDELKTPEFQGYTESFATASRDVARAAGARDLDAAARAYAPLVASCYACHRYRKAARLAFDLRQDR
ncbi:MAG: cytochrome c [Acidobacteria bacterium]|nr:cytochrome c [Acidobacteriota bacterium]